MSFDEEEEEENPLDKPFHLIKRVDLKRIYKDEEETFVPDYYRYVFPAIRAVIEDRDAMLDNVASSYFDKVMTPDMAEAFGADAEAYLRWTSGARAIEATVAYHMGEKMDRPLWRQLCWQISSNEDRLRLGIALPPDMSAYMKRWVVADVAGVNTQPLSGSGCQIDIRTLMGRPTGLSMRQDMSERMIAYMAGQLGYRGFKDWYQWPEDPFYLFGLFMVVYVDEMRVQRFACPPKLWEANRRIIRMRYRTPEELETEGPPLDANGEPIEGKRTAGCPLLRSFPCWSCDKKRHMPLKQSQLDPAGETCPAGY